MAIFFSQGGPVLNSPIEVTKVCLKAVFETKVSLKAIWHQCND